MAHTGGPKGIDSAEVMRMVRSNPHMTFAEIAPKFGISAERVRQIAGNHGITGYSRPAWRKRDQVRVKRQQERKAVAGGARKS